MKIGITCYPTYGGSGAVATELGIALAARGHEVHFITYRQPFRLPSFLNNVYFHEVDVGRYPLFEYPPYDLALAVKMHEIVRDRHLDILHCHYAIPHATSAWIAREMLRESGSDVKVVTTLHGTDITIVGQERSFYAITKFSIEKSDSVTAVSEYLRDETYRAFGCTACDVDVIHNFIDPLEFDRAAHAFPVPLDVVNGRKVLMHISNFRAVKRIRDVVRVFARVSAAMPAVLLMVGDGPERNDAETEARELGVASDVVFLGKIDPVAPLLAGADLFLLPSNVESFGLSALEALASGVPVIGSNGGGLPEVVRHGITGMLAPVGDVAGMADAAIGLLADPERWKNFSTAAAADARARFAQNEVVGKYESIYERTLSQTIPVTLFQSIVLGVIQGLAEFLPISSSAHLTLAPWAFGWKDPGLSFDVALHAGTLVALLWYFRSDWIALIRSAITLLQTRRVETVNEKRLLLLIVATIPGAIAGKLLNDYAESTFRAPALIATTLIVMGVLLWVADKWSRNDRALDTVSWRDAILIGISQVFALVPGVSRSGSTITAGRALGIEREAAARFSFLMSMPITAAAVALKMPDAVRNADALTPLVAGVLAAAISSWFAIAIMLRYVSRHSYGVFALYRVVLGIAVFGLLFARG